MMRQLGKDIVSELRMLWKGKTIDAIIPPLMFILLNRRLGMMNAILIAMGVAAVTAAVRIARKQKWSYAVGGLGSVMVASAFAWFAGSAKDFFLPKLISGVFWFVVCFLTVMFRKPAAAGSAI